MARFVLLASLALATLVVADVPHLLNVQGLLTDANGDPLTDASYSVTFAIYDAPSGGTGLWTETRSVATMGGLFAIYLGQSTPLPSSVFSGGELWLGIAVEGEAEMTPRQRLTTVPYVFRAVSADTAGFAFAVAKSAVSSDNIADGSIQLSDIGQNGAAANQVIKWNGSNWIPADDETGSGGGGGWVDDGTTVRLSSSSDNVGIGTTAPQEKLDVNGDIRVGPNNDIVFGDDSTSIYATGGDLVLTANDDIHLQPDDDIYVREDQGTAWIHVDNSEERLGIGKVDPEYKLDVVSTGTAIHGTSSGGGVIAGVEGTNENNGLGVSGSSSNGTGVFGTSVAGHGVSGFSTTGIGVNASSGTGFSGYFLGPKSYFEGKVGIGTNDPEYKLTVDGEISIASGGVSKYHINYYQGGLNIAETGVQDRRIHIGDGGNVGIGTADPGAKLGVAGDLKVTGAFRGDITSASGSDGAPFPRPTYDSDWQTISPGEMKTLTHNIGGDRDNYVVDLAFKYTGDNRVHSLGWGLYTSSSGLHAGAYWGYLTNSSISVYREDEDNLISQIRVRIWVVE